MSRWGTGQGQGLPAPWGTDTGQGEAEYCEIADCRILVQMPDGVGERVFRDQMCIFVSPLGHYEDVLEDVKASFDPATGVGDQLDKIGSIVGLARNGVSDERYRVFLSIQSNLLLSAREDAEGRTGSAENIIKICRTFIGDAVLDPIVLSPGPPCDFLLTVPGLVPSEAPILIRFICQAIDATVLGQLGFSLDSNSKWGSVVAPIPGTGKWASTVTPIPGTAVYATVQTIGDKEC